MWAPEILLVALISIPLEHIGATFSFTPLFHPVSSNSVFTLRVLTATVGSGVDRAVAPLGMDFMWAASQFPLRFWCSFWLRRRAQNLCHTLLSSERVLLPTRRVCLWNYVLFVQAQEIRVRASFCMTGARLRTLFCPLAGVVFRAQS